MKILLAALSLLPLLSVARADPLDEFRKAELAYMRKDVGKHFWVTKRFGAGPELCPSAVDRFNECKRIDDVKITVESVVHGALGHVYKVHLDDGRTGYINGTSRDSFKSANLSSSQKNSIRRCERTGPAIGATRSAVRECWGSPAHVNSTTTAYGTTEQLVFPRRGYVYLKNGVVTAVSLGD